MFNFVLIALASVYAQEKCILTDRSAGKSYDFTKAMQKTIEDGYAFHKELYGTHAYVSFCKPINGSKIGCDKLKNSFAIYKYDDGRCLSLGKSQQIMGGSDPYVSFANGDKCDLGRVSSASVGLNCEKEAGVGEITYYRFNEFCLLNAFADTDAVC
ncbi:uncharacterized protein MONOS_4336 [Monocercomonoides exilis]|uniref:uncharacterized protein n=1 Tax=Monocercomonoides exilis TaxID=2049356 RepID=UPI00355A79E6|nr:hypothetical protein MONOS_4336 [Monocercomonoides exilis]|eukprot:MONOS_4336.1-p1 / transcript=MONOS_4336.1 / gene=MONOS_4336 / organism=Monocercomonoides_exilis_PA203 / gene_product=unspecified product / transcript_product=unspecified product / location=Mono_scaffold00114:25409-26157(+) / protein_length=156 / sequence_SO=supercontig / SO=protein_coding / is_pseudo=false